MSSVDSDVSQGNRVWSGARFFEDPCVRGDRALGLSVLSSGGESSSSYSDRGPAAYLVPRLAEIWQVDRTWRDTFR